MKWPGTIDERRRLDLEMEARRLAASLKTTLRWWDNYVPSGGAEVKVDATWGPFLYAGVNLARTTGYLPMGDDVARMTGIMPDHRLLMGVIGPEASPTFLVEFPVLMNRIAEVLGAPRNSTKIEIARRGMKYADAAIANSFANSERPSVAGAGGALPPATGDLSSVEAEYGPDTRTVLDPREVRDDKRRKARMPESYTLKWYEKDVAK